MGKKLDIKKSVFDLVQEYPELKGIMADAGFNEIIKKTMLYSAGKIMTIPKGAKIKGIPIKKVLDRLKAEGFEIIGDTSLYDTDMNPDKPRVSVSSGSVRMQQLKRYLKRLDEGESLEKVRADFVIEFSDVEASEIMEAEQELIKEGLPISNVQRLCDVHSALFHGATKEEKIANAEKAVEESISKKSIKKEDDEKNSKSQYNYANKNERAAGLAQIKGHPLETLTRENGALKSLILNASKALDENKNTNELLGKTRDLSIHYSKKGDLLYTLLKFKYGISGPSDVMWTVDDEIRDEIGVLAKESDNSADCKSRLRTVLKRAEEMIYKEQNILFPICAVNFTDDEWFKIYEDEKAYADCFGVKSDIWEAAESAEKDESFDLDSEIVMPGGHMKLRELIALLNTIPMEITFVDAENINSFFNEGPKVFNRPKMALGRDVFSCHPPKIEPMIRRIIDGFRSGLSDEVPVWMEKQGKSFLVKYVALRDKSGKYLGTVEFVQDMEFAKEHFMNN